MATAAQEIAALTAQVAELTEQVGRIAERVSDYSAVNFTIDVAFRAGYAACQEAMHGRARRTSRAGRPPSREARPRSPRPSHLQPVRSES